MSKQSYIKERLSEFFIVYGVVSLMFSSFSLSTLVLVLAGVLYLLRSRAEDKQILNELVMKTKIEKNLLKGLFTRGHGQESFNRQKESINAILNGSITEKNRENLIVLLQANRDLIVKGENYSECQKMLTDRIISEFRDEKRQCVDSYEDIETSDDSFLYINSKDLTEGRDN